MAAKLFDTVNVYNTPGTLTITPAAGEDVQIDLVAIGNDVTVDFPAVSAGDRGKAIGVTVRGSGGGFKVTLGGALDTLISQDLFQTGDCELFTWDAATGTGWRYVGAFRRNAMVLTNTRVETPTTSAAIDLFAGDYVELDLHSTTADVPLQLPAIGNVGQLIAVEVIVAHASYTYAAVPSDGGELFQAGDFALYLCTAEGPSVWEQILLSRGGAYRWRWANATERAAQSVSAADLGAVGYQSDIALGFQLTSESGSARWGAIADPTMGVERYVFPIPNSTTLSVAGLNFAVNSGTTTARAITSTNRSTQLARMANLTAAGAGAVAVIRSTSNTQTFMTNCGARRRWIVTPGNVSANMRWFVGWAGVAAYNVSADPNTFLNCFGIGCSGSGDTNLQLYTNDAAGTATKVDLGATIGSPRTVDSGFIFDIYTLAGATYAYQVSLINTGAVVSGAISANVPDPNTLLFDLLFVNNNTDAVAVSIDLTSLRAWQRVIA